MFNGIMRSYNARNARARVQRPGGAREISLKRRGSGGKLPGRWLTAMLLVLALATVASGSAGFAAAAGDPLGGAQAAGTTQAAATGAAGTDGNLWLYQNGIASGFHDRSFGYSSRNQCDRKLYVSAPCSYAIAYKAWGGINFSYDAGNLDLSPYSTLEWNLNSSGLPLKDFSVLLVFVGGQTNEVVLSAQSVTQSLTGGWVHIAVPVSQIDPSGQLVTNVQLKNATKWRLSTIHVDDVGLAGGGGGPTTGTVSGTVTNSNNVAFFGATVSVGALSTTTGSDGSYSLANVPTGSQTVQASDTGYVSQSKSVNVTAGGTVSASFALAAVVQPPTTGTVSGTVSDSATHAGIGNASVSVDGTSISTSTAGDGSFTLSNVPGGNQSLTVSASGYTTQSKSVSVTAGSTSTVAVALVASPSGSGSALWLYQNGVASGFHDYSFSYNSRNPCDTSAYVSAPCSYAIAYQAWGGIDFSYDGGSLDLSPYGTLEWNLNPNGLPVTDFSALVIYAGGGSNEIVLSPSSVTQTLAGGWVHVSVPVNQLAPAGQLITNVHLKNAINASLPTVHIDDVEFVGGGTGGATSGTIAGKVTDSNNVGLSGATVSSGARSTTTASNGTYTLSNVATGSQTVVANLSGYSSQSKSASVSADATVTVNFSLAASTPLPTTGTVTGTVTDSNSRALAGATVTIGTLNTTTGSDGSYTLTGVPSGSRTVNTSLAGYLSQSKSVSVVAGGSVTIAFSLSAAPSPATSGLHVSGNRLLNGQNQQVILRGVDYAGPEYACIQGWGIFDGPSDAAMVQAMASWKINAVNIGINEDCWLGINGVAAAYGGATYQQAIVNFAKLLESNGITPIIALFWEAPGTQKANGQTSMPDADHAPPTWQSVANTFKSDTNVVFRLKEEPYPGGNGDSDAAWKCWRDGGSACSEGYAVVGMQSLINTIRGTGAANVIQVPGVQYANSMTKFLTYKPSDPLNNLMAVVDVYPNGNICGSVTCYDTNYAPVIAQMPFMVGEFGESVDGNVCSVSASNTLMTWMDQHNSGYLAWTWDTWGTSCGDLSLILSFDGTPKSPNGTNYRSHLLAVQP